MITYFGEELRFEVNTILGVRLIFSPQNMCHERTIIFHKFDLSFYLSFMEQWLAAAHVHPFRRIRKTSSRYSFQPKPFLCSFTQNNH